VRADGKTPVCTYTSMRGIDSEAAPKIARGEKSTRVRSQKVERVISMSSTRCRGEEMKMFIASAAAGRHELQ